MGHHWSSDCSRSACIVHAENIFDVSFLLLCHVNTNPDVSVALGLRKKGLREIKGRWAEEML